jgi:enterochelin esterase family protein
VDRFGWVGSFSAGGLASDFDADFPQLASKPARPHLLWIACGTEDGLNQINRSLKSWLKGKNVAFTDIETPGAHTWMVWRRNLATFAPLLFRKGGS